MCNRGGMQKVSLMPENAFRVPKSLARLNARSRLGPSVWKETKRLQGAAASVLRRPV